MQFPVWTKPAIYGVAVGAVATMILGFGWGGWVTGGSAQAAVDTAAKEARTDIVASLCVNKFASAPDARSHFDTLKKESSWKRAELIEKGGWATFAGIEAVKGAASACASELAALDELPTPVVQPNIEPSLTEG
ncbi:hypothetical protein [Phyllobacterium sp. K27]